MKIIRLESHNVFQENTYILVKNEMALIIDPGDEPAYISQQLDKMNYKVMGVLATHGHVDHVLSASHLCKICDCPFLMSSLDLDWLMELENMCDHFQLPYYGSPGIDIDIAEKKTMDLGDFSFNILHTPGHSPGGVCFLFDDKLFSGDTLFRHSIGRSDLPGGDLKALQHSIKKTLLILPEETLVYPGHLEETTIKEEKRSNPFIIL
jgi:hydroxyacylglutathione hydrolase